MTGPILTQNRVIAKPQMKDLLDIWSRQVMLQMNCHAIATIQSFDPEEQTVTATIDYCKTMFRIDQLGNPHPQNIEYPPLIDVPIIILGGGGASLRFPISVGDECMILFNDRDMDNWIAGAKSGPVASQRLHSFSDGIALIGFNSGSAAWDTTRAALQFGSTRVAVSENKILIENATTTLNTLLAQLIGNIQSLVTQTAAIQVAALNGPVSNAAAITAIAAQLTSTATAIGALLE